LIPFRARPVGQPSLKRSSEQFFALWQMNFLPRLSAYRSRLSHRLYDLYKDGLHEIAWQSGNLVASFLYGVKPTDIPVMAGAASVLSVSDWATAGAAATRLAMTQVAASRGRR